MQQFNNNANSGFPDFLDDGFLFNLSTDGLVAYYATWTTIMVLDLSYCECLPLVDYLTCNRYWNMGEVLRNSPLTVDDDDIAAYPLLEDGFCRRRTLFDLDPQDLSILLRGFNIFQGDFAFDTYGITK